MNASIIPVATIALRLWSSSSLWMLYHTACGTYSMAKYVYTISNDYATSKPYQEILFSHGEEVCKIKQENEYVLIMTNETWMNDFAKLREEVHTHEYELVEKKCLDKSNGKRL
mgnify:FL=1